MSYPSASTVSFRVRIGVTGHRRLDNPASLQAVVKQALDVEMPRLFRPESRAMIDRVRPAGLAPISYRVLTALAEGADRFVARAVLEFPRATLQAVLPLTIEDYLEDFASEESRQEFRELLALCRCPVLLRTRNIRDEQQSRAHEAELRNHAYGAAGQYVVDHCDVMLAVWDGKPARGRGGTAEIVDYALKQGRPVIRIWQGGPALLNATSNSYSNAPPPPSGSSRTPAKSRTAKPGTGRR